MAKTHQMSNIVRACVNEPWLIQEEKLAEIASFLELRASGMDLNEEQLREKFGEPKAEAEVEKRQLIDGRIQVIDCVGTLMPRANLMMRYSGGTSSMQLAQMFREAKDDSDVKSVLVRMDSPGGAASYVPEVADAIKDLSAVKRVVVSAENMVCSGGYWIGAAADEFNASPSCIVGSIGVYTILSNYKELYDKMGVKFTVLRAGNLKASGNPYEEITPERLGSLQKSVDDIYAAFVQAVADYRKTTPANVEKNFGQGSTFLAGEAKSRGMIDNVLTFQQVVARERERTRVASKTFAVVKERQGMNPKLKAAMFARDLIESIEADDATCEAALRGYKAAIGRESMTEEEAIKHLTGKETILVQGLAPLKAIEPSKPDAVVRDEKTVAAEERVRITEIKDRGALLGASEEEIQAAIDNAIPVKDAMDNFTKKLASSNRPVVLKPLESEADKFSSGAAAALCMRYEQSVFGEAGADEETRSAMKKYGKSLANTRTIDLVRMQMRTAGLARAVSGDDYEDALTYLKQMSIFASGGSINQRGDHPDLVSNLVGKSLNQGAQIAEVTYPGWCTRIEDLPDFKPRHFIDVGIFRALDAINEDEPFQQLKFESQISNWIKADRYGDKVGLTPEMVKDDDLGGFAQQMRSLTTAARLTLQRDIIDLLFANPVMLDGNAFFSVAHKNYIASGSGGPISATQLKTHRTMHRKQTSFGAGALPMGAPLRSALVPAEMEDAALQTLAPVNTAAGIEEMATKQADGSLNTFRGKVTPIIDSFLDGASLLKWFTMTSRDYGAPLVYAFQRGFGADGQRDDWYDPERKTRYVSIEIRFGVALSNWRTIVMNDGN